MVTSICEVRLGISDLVGVNSGSSGAGEPEGIRNSISLPEKLCTYDLLATHCLLCVLHA